MVITVAVMMAWIVSLTVFIQVAYHVSTTLLPSNNHLPLLMRHPPPFPPPLPLLPLLPRHHPIMTSPLLRDLLLPIMLMPLQMFPQHHPISTPSLNMLEIVLLVDHLRLLQQWHQQAQWVHSTHPTSLPQLCLL